MIIGNFNYNKAQDTYTGEIATLVGRNPQAGVQAERGESRQGSALPGHRSEQGRRYRVWRGVEKAHRRRPGIPLGQARRSGAGNADQLRAGDVQPRRFPSGVVARQPQKGRLIRPGRGGPQGPPFGSCPARSDDLLTSCPEGCRAASESDRNGLGCSRVSPPHTVSPLRSEERATQPKGEGHAVSPHRFGRFLNAADIVALSPQHDDDSEEIAGWIATCTDGRQSRWRRITSSRVGSSRRSASCRRSIPEWQVTRPVDRSRRTASRLGVRTAPRLRLR